MMIGALVLIDWHLVMAWVEAVWYETTILDTLVPTWDELRVLATLYSWICWIVWMTWSVFVTLLSRVPVWIAELIRTLRHLIGTYQTLTNEIRFRPYFVWTGVLIFVYWMLVIVVSSDLLFDLALGRLGTPIPGSRQEWREIMALPLLGLGFITLMGLLSSTFMYMVIPEELERIRLGGVIPCMFFLLLTLFSMWWVFFTAAVENFSLVRPGAFVFADGQMGRPIVEDFLFYTFAVMTNASYGELKPVGTYAHWMVLAMTATGLALFIVFVGVALSLRSQH